MSRRRNPVCAIELPSVDRLHRLEKISGGPGSAGGALMEVGLRSSGASERRLLIQPMWLRLLASTLRIEQTRMLAASTTKDRNEFYGVVAGDTACIGDNRRISC